MLKRTMSLYSRSNAHDKKSGLVNRVDFSLWTAILFLIFAACGDSLAQRQSGCDSLEAAWHYYGRAEFDKALALIANCEEPSGLELRAFIAFKNRKMSLGDTLICKLFQQARNYEFDPKRLPLPNFMERVKKVKKELCPQLEKKRFGLRNPPLLIERETNILHWQEANFGVSGNWGTNEEKKNPIIFHVRGNLAYLAELEFRTAEIVNGRPKGQAQLPTLAIRVQLPIYRIHSSLPIFNAVFRNSIEFGDMNVDKPDNIRFQKGLREVRLFLSSFDRWRTFELHAGVTVISPRSCVYEKGAVRDSVCVEEMDNHFKKSRKTKPFAAFQWRASQEAMFMITWETLAEYRFNGNKAVEPAALDVVTINIRALPVSWLAFDLGGIWYKDLREDNYNLKLGATFGFSLRGIFRKLL